MSLFEKILYKPLFNALIFLYNILPGKDFGFAVILLTILIRLAFYPLISKSIKSQKEASDFQKEIEEIRQKYKRNREEQAKAFIELYKKKKFNPFSGLLTLLIQLPILIALYRVFLKGFDVGEMKNLYSFIPAPSSIDPIFLGLIDLSKPNIFLAALTGISQFFQSKIGFQKKETKDSMTRFSNLIQNQILYFLSIITFLFLLKLPSALALYWLVSIIFSIFQQNLIFKRDDRKK